MSYPIFRICAYSRKKEDASSLFKVTRTKDGKIVINNDNKVKGRSAYLSKDKDTILNAKKRHTLSKALKVNVSDDIYDSLLGLL